MPEGDTIYRAAAMLARALVGRTVTRFETAYAQLARIDDDAPLAGRTIEAVWSEGKHLLMRFSGGHTLRTHMRMNGSWHIYRPGDAWQRPRRDLRILIETGPAPPTQRRARRPTQRASSPLPSRCPSPSCSTREPWPAPPSCADSGPILLAETFDPLRRAGESARRPGPADQRIPLDQSVAAGAGNVYRSEVLFLCRLSPARLTSSVSDGELEALFTLTRKLMRANVSATGAAGGPQIVTYTGLRRTTGRSDPGERLWVYGRAGRPCRRCGTPISYQKVGPDARGLYFVRELPELTRLLSLSQLHAPEPIASWYEGLHLATLPSRKSRRARTFDCLCLDPSEGN